MEFKTHRAADQHKPVRRAWKVQKAERLRAVLLIDDLDVLSIIFCNLDLMHRVRVVQFGSYRRTVADRLLKCGDDLPRLISNYIDFHCSSSYTPLLSKFPDTACGPFTLNVHRYRVGLIKTVTLEMSAPVVLAGLVLFSVNAKTSWLVIPPPLFTQLRVVLPF
jgi:hypothetical protein